ncbi:MAG: Sulfate permease [candidate division TM6 bacterium GW2011_GWF2_37_49]|nr:MAG: Sulfate permease [candidate division TM6 bacterium GW2011_GWF2_37_49]
MHQSFILKKIKENWKSGLAVSLVSIPLSISLAIASRATPIEGVITAIWAGFMASIFGGSNYNIIGPTGALSGILTTYAIIHGHGTLSTLAIMSGIIIFIAYFFKLEKYLIFVPSSTINGFVLGISFIIVLNQMNFALGLSNLPQNESFISNILESIKNIGHGSSATFLIFIIFVAALFAILKKMPSIPGAIIISPFGILLGYLSTKNIIPFHLQTLETKFGEITPQFFVFPSLKFIPALILPAFTIALISILETMISARIADGITKTKHGKQKEMLGLSLANITCGLAGGIPATAALARTTLNISSGATNKISASISSIFTILISFLLLGYFKFMPLAVVAAILTVVGIRMIEREHFVRMYKIDKKNFILAIIVALVTIFEDPIIGILLGVTLSMLIFMQKISHGQFELSEKLFDKSKQTQTKNTSVNTHLDHATQNQISDISIYSIKGILVYINAQSHISRFEKHLPVAKNIVLDLKTLFFIDQDGIDALDEIIEYLHQKNKTVFVVSSNTFINKMLENSHIFNALKKQGLTFESMQATMTVINKI